MTPNPSKPITGECSGETTLVNRSNRIIVSVFSAEKEISLHSSSKCLQKDRPNANPYDTKPGEKPYKLEIVWRNVLIFIYLHATAAYAFTDTPKRGTLIVG